MPEFGLVHLPDRRDARYPMSLVLGAEPPLPTDLRARAWDVPEPPYDQDGVPSCVGWAWAAYLTAMDPTKRFDGLQVYEWAQQHDGMALPHYGTTLRAGAEFCLQVGELGDKLQSYLWVQGTSQQRLDQVCQWILTQGPVVIALLWRTFGMSVDDVGFLHPTGPFTNGHAVLAHAVDLDKRFITIRNSWGEWGMGRSYDPKTGWQTGTGTGDAYISFDDLLSPLPDVSNLPFMYDAVVATEQLVTPLPPPPPKPPVEEDMIHHDIVYVPCGPAGQPEAGNGYTMWTPGVAPDPDGTARVKACWTGKQGPYPPRDGYWDNQAAFDATSQPDGDQVCVAVRNGPPGQTVGVWAFAI